MHPRIRLPVALLALVSTTTAWSAEWDNTATGNPSGAYVGVGWGRFNLKVDSFGDLESGINSITHSKNDAFKINAGWRFSPYFALEADYINFGHTEGSFVGTGSDGNYNLHVSGFAPFAVGTLPIGPFEVFGKAGWLFYDNNLKLYLNAPGQEAVQSSHSTSDFIYGAGLGFTFINHLNVNAEYDRVRVENASNSDALWLAAQWRF